MLVDGAGLLGRIRSFLEILRREASPLTVLQLRELSKIPVLRRGNPVAMGHPKRPSLLEALRTNDELLSTLAFFCYNVGSDLTKRQVRRRALQLGLPIPAQQDWEWYESVMSPPMLRAERRLASGRALVSWEGEWNEDGLITSLKPHNSRAVPLLGAFSLRAVLVSVVGTTSFQTPFDLRRDRQALARILTKGLSESHRIRRALSRHPLGAISVFQLKTLHRLGEDAV